MAKKNPDYSDSAENLTNKNEVLELLKRLQQMEEIQTRCKAALEESELMKDYKANEQEISECKVQIKSAIDIYGSFQDVEKGFYAVKQRRRSFTYIVSRIKQAFPKFHDSLIEETVNVEALNGLIKGGLIQKEAADKCADFSDTFGYIIKVV